MSKRYNLRCHSNINWKQLCFGEPLPRLKKESTTKREILDETFEIERLITRKAVPQEGICYLVKWVNYPSTETTWEPESHIDLHSLEQYYPLHIDQHRLASAASVFEDAVQERLRRGNRSNTAVIRFDHDIFRYCFRNDNEIRIESVKECDKLPLCENWNYRIDKNGTGLKIKFPILLRPKLRMRKIFIRKDEKIIPKTKPLEFVQITTATCNF